SWGENVFPFWLQDFLDSQIIGHERRQVIECMSQDILVFNMFRWKEMITVAFFSHSYRFERDTPCFSPVLYPGSLWKNCQVRQEELIVFISPRGRMNNRLVEIADISKEAPYLRNDNI